MAILYIHDTTDDQSYNVHSICLEKLSLHELLKEHICKGYLFKQRLIVF